MKPLPDNWTDNMEQALSALYSREPVTDEQRAEHRRLVAKQAARDEAERNRTPQVDLLKELR